jgi:DNA-directed RNA polymerase subunit L
MIPIIQNIKVDADDMTFTLTGVNFSLANAIRRTILADIPRFIFKTMPHEENKANILVNTSRMNNEILKLRLSCIPIHITELNFPFEDYIVEISVENDTDTIIYVTTKDFKIKNKKTNEYLSEEDTREIFPANEYGYFIDFVRLRPKISDTIPGEKLEMTCELSVGYAKQDYKFNVVSTCSYGFTVDPIAMENELRRKTQEWKDQGMNKEKIEFESKNWRLLEGKRFFKKDSFDFVLETTGIYTNNEIVKKACAIIIEKLMHQVNLIESDELIINESENTMENCYDIILQNEDYTIGKIIEYILNAKYFEEMKILTYCGFIKMHPHDADSIVRVAYKEHTDKDRVKQNVKDGIEDVKKIFEKIRDKF